MNVIGKVPPIAIEYDSNGVDVQVFNDAARIFEAWKM